MWYLGQTMSQKCNAKVNIDQKALYTSPVKGVIFPKSSPTNKFSQIKIDRDAW